MYESNSSTKDQSRQSEPVLRLGPTHASPTTSPTRRIGGTVSGARGRPTDRVHRDVVPGFRVVASLIMKDEMGAEGIRARKVLVEGRPLMATALDAFVEGAACTSESLVMAGKVGGGETVGDARNSGAAPEAVAI